MVPATRRRARKFTPGDFIDRNFTTLRTFGYPPAYLAAYMAIGTADAFNLMTFITNGPTPSCTGAAHRSAGKDPRYARPPPDNPRRKAHNGNPPTHAWAFRSGRRRKACRIPTGCLAIDGKSSDAPSPPARLKRLSLWCQCLFQQESPWPT